MPWSASPPRRSGGFRNGVDALGRVREATGVAVTVLPGVEEARLTYLAARRWTAFSARRLVVDIGGGSLRSPPGRPTGPTSPRACRRARPGCHGGSSGRTRCTPRSWSRCGYMPLPCSARSPSASGAHESEVACATSKTFRNLGRLARALPEAPTPPHAFGFAGVDGQTAPVLTREALDVVAGYLAATTARQRSRLAGLDGASACNVVAGSQAAALVMQAFGLRELVLAPWALREGVIVTELARRDPGRRRCPTTRGAAGRCWTSPAGTPGTRPTLAR